MLFCLVPTGVFAEGETATGSAAIQLGTDALSKNVNTATAPTVYFGQDHENNPGAWRVIDYDGNSAAGIAGNMTLLAANNMGLSKFGASNAYADSALKEAIDALADKLTAKETDAVEKRTLASGNYDEENTDGVAGPAVSNAVFWPLSSKEANAVNNDLRVVDPEHPGWASSYWWLRSPDEDYSTAFVAGRGEVRYYGGYSTSKEFGVRPAFDLNLDSVLFASAAVGGKPEGGLTPISEYGGNEWKLTLLDSSRNFAVTEKAADAAPGDTVTLHYTGATTGINEYISAIIADNSGTQYYSRVAQPTAESGTVEIKIPSDLAPGDYTLKVFNEQYNGDYNTDYASNFTDIALTVENQPDEQFTLTPGGRYYFDLSAMNIPGTLNSALPDGTLHYVPFTYVGTVEAYKLTSAMATTEEYAQQNKYAHSLFVADYAVTLKVNWNNLDTASLIFGKNYASGGVDYTLRAPSVGSGFTGSGDSERGTPQSNEWDAVLDKNSGYVKNWNDIYSWGQDTSSYESWYRAVRGYGSARYWSYYYAASSDPRVGFRPVLEVLNADTLGPDGLKVVTLDLNGGKLGGSSDAIHIIVKNGSKFTAPASNGLTRPAGNTGSYFMWLGSDGKLYAPGDSVPADVTNLTAQFALSEQFSLKPGGTYYFDLSAMGIPGTVNDALPDNTLHYVPFTYAGTVDAYKLMSEMATTEDYAQQNKYPHSLFVADYVVTHTVSWNDLNTKSLIFGKDYVAGGVGYTLRAPSVGSSYTGSDDSERGTPKSNEWDKILDKDDGYIKNWGKMLSCGQDTTIRISALFRAVRGWKRSARFWTSYNTSYLTFGFRPVLEVPNPGTLGADGLKAVTLNLGGGKLGGSSDAIHIIVKNGSKFTAPASGGLTRPAGDTGSYFMWLDSNGNSYAPGASVPADVTELTVQWTAPTYTVTLNAGDGTINSGNVTEYTYGVGATLPTDVTRTGYTFKGWYYNENLTGSPVTAIGDTETGNKEYWAKWEINQYTVTVKPENGEADITITQDYGTPISAPTLTRDGYQFNGWDKAFPTTMPAENLTITAQWRDIAAPTGEIKIAENDWKSFFNTITFDLFFKDTQMVTVTAADNSGKAVTVEYLLRDKALTESELAGMTFTAYSAPFSINPDNEYVIYAKLTDTSGNVAYINTNVIVLDATVPVISGIEAGKTYCAAQTITVDEKYIGTVKVNSTKVILDENSQFALSPASGEQTIVVTDKAGNETKVTVTVNDGHSYEWQSENGQYWQKCKFCNHETAKKDIPTINISGADKVCRTQDYKFSFTLPEGATGAAYGYEFIGFGDGPLTPTVENGLYSGIIKASTYPAKENSFKLIVSAKTADGFAFSAEKKVTIQNEHTGGTATCKDKAKCEVCGESYGKLDPNNHANLKHIDAKAATKTSEGNIEYWYCDGCNKYYKDAKATQEITKAQTVTAKLPPKITAGDGATVTQGEKKELSFTSDASFADFLRVELDGTTLDEKNYTKKEGSTIITLNRDFVASLSVGEHTLSIVSKSGTATAKFTVKAKPTETATPQPTVTPQPTAQPQPTVQPVSPIPSTGDTANPALWFALLIVSGSALAAIFVLRRKANRK